MNEYLQDEREIKGYVEIEYSNICNNTSQAYEYPEVAPISFPDDIDSSFSNKFVNNYASLENNYFLLDGSFVLPDYNFSTTSGNHGNSNSGYITNEILNNYSFYVLFETSNILTNESNKMRGLTIYTKDNIPEKIKINVKLYNSNEILEFNIEDNNQDIIQIDFNDDYLVERIDYNFSNMEYDDRRLRIAKIEYGLTDVLKDEKLINFNIIQNIGDLNLEFPSNQISITMYDEDNKFDLMNPKGFANLLNQNVKIKPYIGIVTKENGIVYNTIGNFVNSLGIFFLNNWTKQDNEIILNGIDYLEKLKKVSSYTRINDDMEDGECLANFGNLDVYYGLFKLQKTLSEEAGFEILNIDAYAGGRFGGGYYDDKYIDTTNIFDYLQQLIIWMWAVLYCEDEVSLTYSYIGDYNDVLDLNVALLEEPKYQAKEKLKSISIKKYKGEKSNSIEKNLVFETTLKENESIVVSLPDYMTGIIEYPYSTESFYCKKNLELFSGNAGNVKIYQTDTIELITETETRNYNSDGIEINIDNKFFKSYTGSSGFANTLDQRSNEIFELVKNDYKTYNVSFNYIGDPKIKPGRIINIETKYGIKQIKVLKHTLTFNGGLTGSIEGVGD